MLCLGCSLPGRDVLCFRCELTLRPAPEVYLEGVGTVRAAFRHTGVARTLVHHLKYRGVVTAGQFLADALAGRVPAGVVLVPVTRVGWRKLRYGVDPAVELAETLGRITGLTVERSLVAPFLGRARAGGVHGQAPRFRLRRAVGRPVVLVDDVVTTGATLQRAARLFPDVAGALTATISRQDFRTRAASSEVTSVAIGGHHTE